jgi:AbrB family looped-hinge helix DNA binding protein
MNAAHFPKIVGTATLNDKGQLVIPVEARNKLGLTPGSRIVIMSSSEKPALTLIKAEVLEAMVRDLTDALDSTTDSQTNT